MHEFPYTQVEWDRLVRVALASLDASRMSDAVLEAAALVELRATLDDLRTRHGEHPVLLETEADFADDPLESERLYDAAVALATRHGLPTVLIRLSLARLLIETLGRPADARRALDACRAELGRADADERAAWDELDAACGAAGR